MEAADEDVSLPWRWILEHIVDMKDVGTPILRGLMTYLPNPALYSSLQKRTALRYLEEAIAGGKIDAHVIPLVAVLLKESQATSSYPTTSDYNDLLLRVQVEAVIMHIRGKLRDWHGFSQVLDRIFPENTMDAQYLEKRKELSTLMQVQGQEKKRVEVLECYSLTALRHDLLKSITSEKARLERTFLDKLLQDVFNGKYPVSAGSIGKPASEKEDSQEDFHSADGQRHSIGSDDQTVLGGRNSNAESEDAVEANLKDSATTHMPREDSIAGVHPTRKRVGSQNGNGPTKRTSHGHPDLRQRDEHGKVVKTASPRKDMQNFNLRSPLDKEVALEVEEASPNVEFLEVGSDGHEEFCHKCKEGGNLLCCDGCPIAVHRKCLGFDSKSFEEEEWFCPLCAQKKAVEAVKKAREEELAARQRVLQFVRNADEKRTHEKRTRSSIGPKRKSEQNGEKKVPDGTKKAVVGQQDGAKTSSEKLDSKADASKRASSPLNGKEKQNSNKASDASKRASSPSNGKERQNLYRVSTDPYKEYLNIITKSGIPLCPSNINGSGMLYDKNHRKGKRIEERDMQNVTLNETPVEVARLSTGGDGIDYNRHTNVASSSKSGQINPANDPMSQANVDVQVGDEDHHDGDLEEDSEGRKPKSPKVKKDPRLYFRGNRIIPGMRRKRLPWKKEEEDALREGIRRFSRDDGGWGFQWTRILEFGQGKFHPSRTDVDLKDKWRNLAKTLQ